MADDEIGAQGRLASVAGQGVAIRVHHFVGGTTRRGAPADNALDAVLGHEVHRPLAGTDDRLPAFDRHGPGFWYQRDVLQLIAPVGNTGWNGVVVAIVREGATVERLEDDFDLVFEQHAVGLVVDCRAGGAEHLALPRVVATPHPKKDAAAGEAVSDGEIFR